MQLRLGTRASTLARWQADWVSEQLRLQGVEVQQVLISTQGDRQQQEPIGAADTVGVFTKEIQRALLERRIDLSVHSLKDLPTDEVHGLVLAAVPVRAPVCDALLGRTAGTLAELPAGATVGTGSLRRRAQLRHARPDLAMRDIRGNVDTRIRKLQEGQFDAIVLAEAGLRRLGLQAAITEVLPISLLLPAVGQGALGLETRADDQPARQALAALDDAATHHGVLAERAMLARLRGGCLAPVAAWGRLDAGRLWLTGRVLSVDGRRQLEVTHSVELVGGPSRPQAQDLGRQVADELLGQGAAELISAAREGDA